MTHRSPRSATTSHSKDRLMNTLHRKTAVALAAAALASALPQTAGALDYEFNGIQVRNDNKLSIGGAWRVSDRKDSLVGISNGGEAYSTNGDDGNLAFDQGDVIASAIKLTSDLTITRGGHGLFLRGSYLYDPTLNEADYFSRANYRDPSNPATLGKEAPLSEYEGKTGAVQNHLGDDADLLDAFVFGSSRIGERMLGYKIGRQVLNWGESTLVQNGLNSIMSADANQLHVPGVETEEVLKPVGMAFASISLIENVSVEGFYQFEWRKTQPDAAGSPWSTNDFVGTGGTRANLSFGIPGENDIGSTTPRAPDREPEDGGQFGVALRSFLPQLHDVELALYAANYHSRLPLVSGISATEPLLPFGSNYFIEYPEDIEIYGISFNTALPWTFSIQGEYSYKVGQPLQLDDVEILLAGLGIPSQLSPVLGASAGNQYLQGYRRHDVSQLDVGLTHLSGPNRLLRNDQAIMVFEVGYNYVHGLPPTSELRYEAPGTYLPAYEPYREAFHVNRGRIDPTDPDGRADLPVNTNRYPTAMSWGYKVLVRLQYNNAIGAVKLEPLLRYDHDVSGITPTPIGNFIEGRKLISAALGFTYLNAWSGEVGYVVYTGGGAQNLLSDRDYVEASLRYAF